jgi:hypothetical protein
MKSKIQAVFVALVIIQVAHFQFSTARAQGTTFTYQGRLNANGGSANGVYDFNFGLFSVSSGGSALGSLDFVPGVSVTGGLFTVSVDFGTNFPGAARWLEIAVRTNAGPAYTTLAPRQPITPVPYAITAGSVVGNGLAAGVYSNAVTFNNPANSFVGDGSGLANVNAATLGGLSSSNFWKVGGNAGTSGGFIGTIDNQPFDLRVNNVRAMRYRLNTDSEANCTNAPNVIGGSSVNTVSAGVVGATIGGGGGNSIIGQSLANQVNADFATVSGGQNGTASGDFATVGGGYGNTASGAYATVAGGDQNNASGDYGMVPGGAYNTAGGNWSFAAGYQAHAGHQGAFVWADFSPFTFSSTIANQFRVRATGGVAFATAIDYSDGSVTAGVHVLPGDTAWSSISDRNAKKNFSPVNAEAILERLVAVPMQSWNYKWEPDDATPHLGPMAQDFKGAFYPGRDDKSISTLEFDGVELAAIQGPNQKIEKQKMDLNSRDARVSVLEKEILELKEAVKRLSNAKD